MFFDKGAGYYLKRAEKGALEREAIMGAYFSERRLAPKPVSYVTKDYDYLLTEKLQGEDGTHEIYLREPKKLAKIMGEILRELHESDFSGCPVQNRLTSYYETVKHNYENGLFDLSYGSFSSADEAYRTAIDGQRLLTADTLIHGDFCLPNFLFDNWRFTGFIDLGAAGVADRHIDLYWGKFTLKYNLGTDEYAEAFFAAYGKGKINTEALQTISACECFG